MTSIRARCLNGLMRITIRRRLRKGVTLEEMREQAAKNDSRAVGSMHNCTVEEVPGTPVPILRIGVPDCREDRAVLYFHGGGFCIHMPQTYQRHAARISAQTNATVYLVDYRLAPDHPVETCFDDAYAAYAWLLDTGIAASSVIIAGDSAGGGLTLGTCQHARDNGLPLPAGMLMIAPGLDATFDTPSMRANDGKDPAFTFAGISSLRDMTLSNGEDPTDIKLSPGRGSLAGLPPMRFDVGDTELLLDDSRNAAQKAKAEGAEAILREWPAMAHVFQIAPWVPETRQWLAEAGEFMYRCWEMAASRQ
jgi:monoterpene epsilon-lactone hydrolase